MSALTGVPRWLSLLANVDEIWQHRVNICVCARLVMLETSPLSVVDSYLLATQGLDPSGCFLLSDAIRRLPSRSEMFQFLVHESKSDLRKSEELRLFSCHFHIAQVQYEPRRSQFPLKPGSHGIP